ncbi:MAG: PIG-L deacetylase family protein [Prolixibacteraceae bacterium]|nr:PIG-L deacetylase family protein [Prolixibacteraceae bacterium]
MKKNFIKNSMKSILTLTLISMNFLGCAQENQAQKLQIVIIGAHPDDPELMAGGTACKWAQMGHDVLMVSLTNGDAGHQTIKPKKLVKIRREEARKAGEVIGAKYITMDNHDGQLMPTYKNRLEVIKIIREAKADIVIFHRPYDYHPDHRYAGTLVLDAAYMVTVPRILPKVPYLKKNPLFLFAGDRFTHPEPFKADVCVAIDDVIEKKIDMRASHKSQMFEWLPYNRGILDQVPESDEDRRAWLGENSKRDELKRAIPWRGKLVEQYGEEKASKIKFCEAFQDSGYGTQLTEENLFYYFPFLKSEMK